MILDLIEKMYNVVKLSLYKYIPNLKIMIESSTFSGLVLSLHMSCDG